MLEALQVVLITAGQGRLELRDTRPQIITAGSAFVFFTRVCHRYSPDAATVGWKAGWNCAGLQWRKCSTPAR